MPHVCFALVKKAVLCNNRQYNEPFFKAVLEVFMKRFIALFVVLMMIVPCMYLNVSAAGEVMSGTEYPGVMTGHWDAMTANGEEVGGGVQIMQYATMNSFTIEVAAEILEFRGWAMCDSEVKAFGYQINGEEPVFSEEYFAPTEQPVYDAGAAVGADYGGRFIIPMDVAMLKGRNSISILADTDEGIYSIHLVTGFDLEIDFVQAGTEAEPTPTPEVPAEKKEPILIRFNTLEAVDDFFLYSTVNSHVTMIDFDEEKLCAFFETTGGPDPNVAFLFAQIAEDEDMSLGTISANDYKALAFIGRFDYDTICNDPEKEIIGTFYFTTDTSTELNEAKNVLYTYEKTDDLQYVVLDFAGNRFWKGELGDCRFDFFATTDNDCVYELYFVGLFADADEANEFFASYKEIGDAIFPTPEPTEAPTETPDVQPTEGSVEEPTAEEPTVEAETEEPTSQSSSEKEEKKGCGGFVAAIPAGALMLAAAVVLAKKKR